MGADDIHLELANTRVEGQFRERTITLTFATHEDAELFWIAMSEAIRTSSDMILGFGKKG